MDGKVYLFLDLLKVKHVFPLQQYFLIAILLGFWMGALPHSALLTTMASKVPALVTHNIQTSIFRVHLDRTVRECCHTSVILI